jgi:hypothetical protein
MIQRGSKSRTIVLIIYIRFNSVAKEINSDKLLEAAQSGLINTEKNRGAQRHTEGRRVCADLMRDEFVLVLCTFGFLGYFTLPLVADILADLFQSPHIISLLRRKNRGYYS